MNSCNNQKKIRNFSIIAHIDHGKSTLADRIIEKAANGNFIKKKDKKIDRILDDLILEKEKGITIRLNAIQLNFLSKKNNKYYHLNLIDTPGHEDFMYEVSKSLKACEGVILLVDAKKGIQAQTVAYYRIAKGLDLKILPVINKIDLPDINLEEVEEQLIQLIKCKKEEIIHVSSKNGKNINYLLEKIIEFIPGPNNNLEEKGDDDYLNTLKALIFDISYDKHLGLIIYLRVIEGKIEKKQKIKFIRNKNEIFISQIEKIGIKTPEKREMEMMLDGEIGWITANIYEIGKIKIGDIIIDANNESWKNEKFFYEAESEYEINKSNIFCNIYPKEENEYQNLKKIIENLKSQDNFSLEKIDSKILGPGFTCGFIGSLQKEVVCERIKKEYRCEIVISSSSPVYKINCRDGKILESNNPQKMPENEEIKSIEELFIEINVITQKEYLWDIIELCESKRGRYVNQDWKKDSLIILDYHIPYAEFIIDFHEKIKGISHGYSSFSYKILGFFQSNIEKIDILLNKKKIPDLSFLTHKKDAYEKSKKICEKIKENIEKENFSISIHACMGKRIIFGEKISAIRKHVTGKLYGGDRTRKMKLWEKQKEGKKKMKKFGNLNFEIENLKKILK